jgi:hypothetical protein
MTNPQTSARRPASFVMTKPAPKSFCPRNSSHWLDRDRHDEASGATCVLHAVPLQNLTFVMTKALKNSPGRRLQAVTLP